MLARPPVHALALITVLTDYGLDMLLESTEVNIEFMEWFEQFAKGCAFGHHGEGIDILREALATIAKLAVRTRDIGVGVVDVAREEHAGVYRAIRASYQWR